MSYQVEVGYKYLEQLPSAAVSNKIIGTYPSATNIGPSASVTALGNIYVTNFNSNTVSIISESTMHLVKTVYAGKQPDAIAFDWKNDMLYVADYYGYTLPSGYNYSTITEINATNNSYVGTINSGGTNKYLFGPVSITFDPVDNSIFTADYGPDINYYNNPYSYPSYLTQFKIITNSFSNNHFVYGGNSAVIEGIAYNYELNKLVLTDSANDGYWLYNPIEITHSFEPTTTTQYYSPYAVGLSNNTADVGLFSSINFLSESGYVLAYNLTTNHEIGSPLQIPYNGVPQNITYSIATGKWYVGVTGTNQIDVISVGLTSGISLVDSINVGLNPYSVGIITDGTFIDYVYSVNFGSNDESVINPSSNDVVYTVWNNYLNSPTSAAYDPVNGFIYVTNGASNNVTIIQSSDNKIIGYVDVGIDPVSAVYDPVNEHIYVANHISNNVSIISNTTIYKSIPLGKSPPAHPLELVYDSLNEHVYVADNTPKNITIISNTSIFSSISLGHSSHPVAIVYDPSNDHIYVANKKTITVISNATIYKTGTFDGNISVGSNPDSMAYDSLNSTILVSHSPPGNNVTVISGTHTFGNFSLLGTEPYSMTFDEGNSYLYIANEGSDTISLFDTTSWNYVNSMGTPSNPDYILYDPENGYLYALSQGQDQLFIIDGGSAFVSGHVGQQVSGAYSGSGTITGTGNTAFTSGKVFELEDGNLIESYVGTNITKSLGIIPFSVLNLSGRVYVTSSLFNITGLPQSISSYGTNVLVLRYNNIVRNDYYVGEFIDVADVYGNIYPAVVTNVTLSNLTYSIHSPNVLSWNESFFQKYGNPLSQTKNPDSNVWDFSNGMFKVKVSGDTMTIYLNKQSELYSIALDYYQIGLISI
jgi:YVTN family beta-propeller protein